MNRIRLIVLAVSLLFALVATWSLVHAQTPKTFGHGDATQGAMMHQKDCVSCHVRRLGGDGSHMYTRPERKVATPGQLKAQIALCNIELGTQYFPDEEEHVAAYLNLRYYKFKD